MKKVHIFATLIVFASLIGVSIKASQAQESIKDLEKRLKILKEKKVKEQKNNQLIRERKVILNKISKIQINIDEIQFLLDEIKNKLSIKVENKEKHSKYSLVESDVIKYKFKGYLCDAHDVEIIISANYVKKTANLRSVGGASTDASRSGGTTVKLISDDKGGKFSFDTTAQIRHHVLEFKGYLTPSGGRAKLWSPEHFCGTNENKLVKINN